MKNKTTQGLGNKKILSFPKHDSLKYWKLKSNVNSHMSIQHKTIDTPKIVNIFNSLRFDYNLSPLQNNQYVNTICESINNNYIIHIGYNMSINMSIQYVNQPYETQYVNQSEHFYKL